MKYLSAEQTKSPIAKETFQKPNPNENPDQYSLPPYAPPHQPFSQPGPPYQPTENQFLVEPEQLPPRTGGGAASITADRDAGIGSVAGLQSIVGPGANQVPVLRAQGSGGANLAGGSNGGAKPPMEFFGPKDYVPEVGHIVPGGYINLPTRRQDSRPLLPRKKVKPEFLKLEPKPR